jgi:predicted phage terminase large subunit-like protein
MALIGASHTADLAEAFSRRVMRTVREHTDVLGYGLATESVGAWGTSHGAEYKAAGVGGPITGRRADCAIVDDPVKSRADAESETYRERTWDWYSSDLRTRLKPGGRVVLIMCMVGDTPVMLADGSERLLRDISVGDKVATYRDGVLSTSVVRQWASNGLDRVFTIKMTSGVTVTANARHPFLVCEEGKPKWVRTKDLRQGHEIYRVNGESGKARLAHGMAAKSRLAAVDTAHLITTRRGGKTACGRHVSVPHCAAVGASRIVTASLLRNMIDCSRRKMASVLYADSRQGKMFAPTGAANFASIIATIRERLGGFFATIATFLSVTQKHRKPPLPRPNTSDFILDKVIEVRSAGIEEVFDVQIDHTENFIASGLVSHNTRWHMDDLGGRLLDRQPGMWRVVSLPAQAGENDMLGRNPGDWLWADDAYGYGADLQKARAECEANGQMRDWHALYQQQPRPEEGSLFKVTQLAVLDAAPTGGKDVRAWDLASTADGGDWTVGARLRRLPDGAFVIVDVTRLRGGPDAVEAAIVNTAKQDGRGVIVSLPQDPGQAGKTQALYLTRKLAGYQVKTSPETGDKITRAGPLAAQVNVGNVSLTRASWNTALIDEMRDFPHGTHDDQVDALSRAFGELITGHPIVFSPELMRRI